MHPFCCTGSINKVYEEEDIPFVLVELQPTPPQPVYQLPQVLIQKRHLHQKNQKPILRTNVRALYPFHQYA
jgi:hypothetical protein